MEGLENWQLLAIALLFVWSGFVRSGLGFGGAVLTLPFLLMVYNAPLVFLQTVPATGGGLNLEFTRDRVIFRQYTGLPLYRNIR